MSTPNSECSKKDPNPYKERYQELLEVEKSKHRCGKCKIGKTEKVPGNGITEPPYLMLVRCPFNDRYYHNLEDECAHPEQCKRQGGMIPETAICINSNNGREIFVSQDKADGKITVIALEADGKCDTKSGYPYDISAGDMVMLLNYYRYVKDNDIQCSFLNPDGHSTRCD